MEGSGERIGRDREDAVLEREYAREELDHAHHRVSVLVVELLSSRTSMLHVAIARRCCTPALCV